MYIKNNENEKSLPKGYIQEFVVPANGLVSKGQVIGLKLDGTITDEDLDILVYVAKMRFVSSAMLTKFAESNKIENIKARLQVLIKNGCLNSFCLIDKKDSIRGTHKIPKDAMRFYCLHEGGFALIKHFTDEYINWNYTDNVQSSKGISKYISSASIYQNIKSSCVNELTYYRGSVPYYIRNHDAMLGSEYRFKNGENGFLYLIVEIYHSSDDEMVVRDKIKDVGTLVCSNIWRRYYTDTKNPPMIFFVADTDEMALKIANEVKSSTKINLDKCRFSTLDRITGDLSAMGSFLKYNAETNELCDTNVKLFIS